MHEPNECPLFLTTWYSVSYPLSVAASQRGGNAKVYPVSITFRVE